MVGYNIKLTTKDVDIIPSNGKNIVDGWISISISKNSYFVYINNKNGNRVYWIGRIEHPISAKLTIKFNDKKSMITFNSYKVIFHNPKQYNEIKQKSIFYNFINKDNNIIKF